MRLRMQTQRCAVECRTILVAMLTKAYFYRAQQGSRRMSRRSSLTDDRVDEVINNLTNMHSMVKLLRESSVDKPDSSRTWDVSTCSAHQF